jgi:tetratricopeptide (TPR) repeat protein
LFELVKFHPLSIALLVQELKERQIGDVGQALARLLQETGETDKNKSIIASLNLSLERLDPEVRQWLPRLGVFAGGAFENLLLLVTEFEDGQWQRLRSALEATGLLVAEVLSDVTVPYFKFHPTLAPVLLQELEEETWEQLQGRHCQSYYELSRYLYFQDDMNPFLVREMAWGELPNMMRAVYQALDAEEEWTVSFATCVNEFLNYFGLNRELVALTDCVRVATVEVGSKDWYLSQSNFGKQLHSAGRNAEAIEVFETILAAFGDAPSYRRCVTFQRLGRCLIDTGQTVLAADRFREGLEVARQLEVSEEVKELIGTLQGDLGNVLTIMRQYEEAKTAYEASLAICREVGNNRGVAVIDGQLGTLALERGDLSEAERCHQEALTFFQGLREPQMEAVAWHQLGRVYQQAKAWDAAEGAYREADRIFETLENWAGIALTSNHLAMVNAYLRKPEVAEAWFRKAIKGARNTTDSLQELRSLNNLANLLQSQTGRLSEARQLAEEALAIGETLDSASAEIWKTYLLLGMIADQENDPIAAKEYRQQAQQTKAAFAGTQYELQQWVWLIEGVVGAIDNLEARSVLEGVWLMLSDLGFENLVGAINRIIEGEREEDDLCKGLSLEEGRIVMEILRQLRDRES